MKKHRLNFFRSPSQITHDMRAVYSVPRIAETVADRQQDLRLGDVARKALINSIPSTRDAPTEASAGVTVDELLMLTGLMSQLVESVQELQQQQRQSLGEMQQATVELAVAAASWLTGAAIDADLFAVDDLVRMALHRLDADAAVRVQLNPQDHVLLKSLLQQTPDAALLEQIVLEDNAALARGGCRVESGRQLLISDLETRLEDIRRLWMENLDATQIERRGDGSHGRALRRFPDRRETA